MLDFEFDEVFSDLEDEDAVEQEFLQNLAGIFPSISFQLHIDSGNIISLEPATDFSVKVDQKLFDQAKEGGLLSLDEDDSNSRQYAFWVNQVNSLLLIKISNSAEKFPEKLLAEFISSGINHALLMKELSEEKVENDQLTREIGALTSQHSELVENNHRQFLLIQQAERDYAKNLEAEIAKQTAELRKANEELLESNRLKSEFLANMSHELRTPMNAIIGFSDLLMEGNLEGENKEYAETIQQSGAGLLTLINDILDFAKIEAGKLDIIKEPFGLDSIVKNVAAMFSKPAQEKNIEFKYTISPEIPKKIIGDANRLKQILVNLSGNAMKFTEHGSVSISVDLIEGNSESCAIRFLIKDTGIGIKTDRQALIFEKFIQEDGSTTRKYGGTGLGLAISSQLVDLMGGRIFIASEVGIGSSFAFTARFKVEDLGALNGKKGQSEQSLSIIKLKVLIVEDNLVNQRLATVLLKREGCETEVAGDGLKALEKLQEQEFDMILMDLQMPNMGGLEATKRIRSIEKSNEKENYAGLKNLKFPVPIVGLSAHAKEKDCKESLEAGMNDFLTKPINKQKLFGVLAEIRKNKEPAQNETQEESLKPIKVLLAEDNLVNQKLASILIKRAGCSAEIANDGLEAVEMVKKDVYDLILMDLQMPNMGGLEATKEIRRLESSSEVNQYPGLGNRKKKIPIVGLSAHARKEDCDESISAGMNDFLTKPIDKNKFNAVLEKIKSGEL